MRRPGFVLLRADGAGVGAAFAHEAGGHRWQRVPPTEKRGRVHTSTVTVAVLDAPRRGGVELADVDLEWSTCRSGGPGGQHANKTDSAVLLRHRPSGVMVRIETEKSQHRNRRIARELLASKLAELDAGRRSAARNDRRRAQVGTGMRGDKRRTVALQRGLVTDHQTQKRLQARRYLRGELEALWPD